MSPSPSPTWLAPSTLTALKRLNDECLALMIDLAARPEAPPEPFALIEELRGPLVQLGPEGRRRACEYGVPLVDFQFRNDLWWQAVRARPAGDFVADRPVAAPRPRVVALARATLTFAWHVVTTEQPAPALLLGASDTVARVLMSFSPGDLSRVATRHALFLRPRWSDRAIAWRRLLGAARSGDPEMLQSMRIYGFQLLAGELLSRAG